jgi:hypothetical protein
MENDMKAGTSGRLVVLFAATLGLIVAGCASVSDNLKAEIIPPELDLFQDSEIGGAAVHVSGGIPVKYRVSIKNPSSETITLYQLALQSIGEGAYTLEPTQRPFKTAILPNHEETVELWAPALASDSILGVNGPVTIRAVAFFHTDLGSFQQVYIRQVNDTLRGQRSPQ